MPWRRWSVSRAALKVVIGQFVGRQTVLVAVILCALAVWFGASTDLRVNPRVAVTGLVLAAVGLTSTIASTWIGSGRWGSRCWDTPLVARARGLGPPL